MIILPFSYFRINKWAENFGKTIFEISAKATGLTDIQTVSEDNKSLPSNLS